MDSKTYISSLEKHGRAEYKKTTPYRVKVPLGSSGPWTIKQFETQMDLAYVRFARDGRPPGLGKFTSLVHERRGTVMSDTLAEINDLRGYLYDLRGHILISGLGLGMVVNILTKCDPYKDHIQSLTVVEKDADVIKLVADFYRKSDPRITIHHADTFTWQPPKGTKYDAAWHDIWDDICEDNRDEMSKLRRHYQKYVLKGKQYCWGQNEMERMRQRSSW